MELMGQQLKPSDSIQMTEGMLEQILEHKPPHDCFLTEQEMQALKKFAMLIDGNEKAVHALIDAAQMIPTIQRTAVGAIVVAILSGIGGMILLGVKAWVEKGAQ